MNGTHIKPMCCVMILMFGNLCIAYALLMLCLCVAYALLMLCLCIALHLAGSGANLDHVAVLTAVFYICCIIYFTISSFFPYSWVEPCLSVLRHAAGQIFFSKTALHRLCRRKIPTLPWSGSNRTKNRNACLPACLRARALEFWVYRPARARSV